MKKKINLLQKELDNYAKQLKGLQRQMSELFQVSLSEVCQEIFKTYPELVAMQWTQYTPYFNDGDACEFTVNDISILFSNNGDGSSLKFEGQNLDDTDEELYGYEDCLGTDSKFKDIAKFELILSSNEGTLQDIFGNHCKVTITRDGIETTDYDHD